jgi:cephalosporin hydroxylase
MRENATQMSFGERAALEGVLVALAPRLAIEIGTAEGGTLARITRYAEEVHSIDISHDELRVDVGDGVHLHTAPSTEVLPALLRTFQEARRDVDFALVDGDHSYDGVIADIRMLLGSPCTARSVILVHDSTNAEIRAGIEAAGIEECDSVVYFEPDFVPGYVYRAGVARHMAWGGLALIICDREHSSNYAAAKRQWRYYEPFAAIQRMRSELRSADGAA